MVVVVLLIWGVVAMLLTRVDMGVAVSVAVLQAAALASYGAIAMAGPRAMDAVESRVIGAATTLWRVVDLTVIDGTLNSVGLVVRSWSTMLRHAQAGSVRVHALALLAGVVALLGYVLWR